MAFPAARLRLSLDSREPPSARAWARKSNSIPPKRATRFEVVCVGHVVPNTELRIADDSRAGLPDETVGHILIRGASVTQRLLRRSRGHRGGDRRERLGGHRRSGRDSRGSLYIAGRAKEIIFVNGQNYYPYDLENIAQRAPGLDLNKVVAAGVAKPGSQGEELVVFVLHRGGMAEFLPTASAVSRLINEHTGLEVAQVIPTKRIPKTTSGKVQRHLLEQAYIDGEFDAELAELEALRESHGGAQRRSPARASRTVCKRICEAALPGKRIDVNDNLFEIGASSLKLIEIHENVDRDFPGLIDLTELFDHPTIARAREASRSQAQSGSGEAGARATDPALKVSQLSIFPESKPRRNQPTRCAEVPCVKLSGTTVPCSRFCKVSSPTDEAALRPCSRSPGSRILRASLACCGPDAGEAIRLQFDPHRYMIRAGAARALFGLRGLVGDAQ